MHTDGLWWQIKQSKRYIDIITEIASPIAPKKDRGYDGWWTVRSVLYTLTTVEPFASLFVSRCCLHAWPLSSVDQCAFEIHLRKTWAAARSPVTQISIYKTAPAKTYLPTWGGGTILSTCQLPSTDVPFFWPRTAKANLIYAFVGFWAL